MQNTVYAAPDMLSLNSAVKNKETASGLCGWERWLDQRLCNMHLSPFTHTIIGVEADQGVCSSIVVHCSYDYESYLLPFRM